MCLYSKSARGEAAPIRWLEMQLAAQERQRLLHLGRLQVQSSRQPTAEELLSFQLAQSDPMTVRRRGCDLCAKRQPPTPTEAVFRVQFGIYAGAYFVCEPCLPKVLSEERLKDCVVKTGMTCVIDRLSPERKRVAVIRRREPSA